MFRKSFSGRLRYAGTFVLWFLATLSQGCSSRDLYNAVQENRLQECQKLYGQARDDCEREHQMSFEEYEQERQEVLSEEKRAKKDEK